MLKSSGPRPLLPTLLAMKFAAAWAAGQTSARNVRITAQLVVPVCADEEPAHAVSIPAGQKEIM